MRWIILRTFPKWFFIVVSNYGLAFTNQFSRCSAINFRANWDISCCSGAHITSHHIISHHITSRKTRRHERSPPQQLMWSDMRFAKFWVWSFQAGEGSWGKNAPDEWLINDVEHQKTILLKSLTAGWLILKTVSKYQDMTFYSSQSLSKLSSICITLTQNKVCAHITCILTFWQP